MPYWVRGCPLVEHLRCEICAVRPGNGPDLSIHCYLIKESPIAQRGEYPTPVAKMREIDIADQAVRELEPQSVVAKDLDVADVWQRSHAPSLGERGDQQAGS